MPDEIYLSPEDEEILDRVWERITEEVRLREQGLGPPRFDIDRARREQPKLTEAELEEWVRVANEEDRRLGMMRIHWTEAFQASVLAANQHITVRAEDRTGPGSAPAPDR